MLLKKEGMRPAGNTAQFVSEKGRRVWYYFYCYAYTRRDEKFTILSLGGKH